MIPYRIEVRWSEPDQAYVAEAPAIPGAGGSGSTATEAVENAEQSILMVLDVMRQHGDPLPPADVEDHAP
jgi:predicted RNase H-like HicB family nuclease